MHQPTIIKLDLGLNSLPVSARKWVLRHLFTQKFRKFLDSVPRYDIEQCGHWIEFTLSLGHYNITIGFSATSEEKNPIIMLIANVESCNGKDRAKPSQQFYIHRYDGIRIHHMDYPYCKICDKREEHHTVESATCAFDIGHVRYHQKLNTYVRKYRSVLEPVVGAISDWYDGAMQPAQHTSVREHVKHLVEQSTLWYSRFIFQCIWQLRRRGTVLQNIPRDICLHIARYAYTRTLC